MNKPPPWYRPRRFVHFDAPLGIAAATRLVTSEKSVAEHAFFPFLRYTVTSQKIQKRERTGRVERKPAKIRPISVTSHAASHIYSYYGYCLSEAYERLLTESGISDSVLAFRALGKSNIDFACDAFRYIKGIGNCTVFATDISGFFDNLDHKILKRAWERVLGVDALPRDHYAIFRSITRFAYVEKEAAFNALGLSLNNPPRLPDRLCTSAEFRTQIRAAGLVTINRESRGIPQGSPISAFLSNIYLLAFDEKMHAELSSRGGRYLRYCDDVLCIVPASSASGISDVVSREIGECRLEINESKTDTIDFHVRASGRFEADRPLQYLGFTFDGQRILIRSAAFAKFSERMRRGVNLAMQTARKHNKKRGCVTDVWRQKLYERYSHLGERNFLRYGLKAARTMESRAIRKQLKPLWGRLIARIDAANGSLRS